MAARFRHMREPSSRKSRRGSMSLDRAAAAIGIGRYTLRLRWDYGSEASSAQS